MGNYQLCNKTNWLSNKVNPPLCYSHVSHYSLGTFHCICYGWYRIGKYRIGKQRIWNCMNHCVLGVKLNLLITIWKSNFCQSHIKSPKYPKLRHIYKNIFHVKNFGLTYCKLLNQLQKLAKCYLQFSSSYPCKYFSRFYITLIICRDNYNAIISVNNKFAA